MITLDSYVNTCNMYYCICRSAGPFPFYHSNAKALKQRNVGFFVKLKKNEKSCQAHWSRSVGLAYRAKEKGDGYADIVRTMVDAGAIPLAVTNVSELCLWMESSNKVNRNVLVHLSHSYVCNKRNDHYGDYIWPLAVYRTRCLLGKGRSTGTCNVGNCKCLKIPRLSAKFSPNANRPDNWKLE